LKDHRALASSCKGTGGFLDAIKRARARCSRLEAAASHLGLRPASACDALQVISPATIDVAAPKEAAKRKAALRSRASEPPLNLNSSLPQPGTESPLRKWSLDSASIPEESLLSKDSISLSLMSSSSALPSPLPEPRRSLVPRTIQMVICQKYGTIVKDWAPTPCHTPLPCQPLVSPPHAPSPAEDQTGARTHQRP
jgi:hypothetical protein